MRILTAFMLTARGTHGTAAHGCAWGLTTVYCGTIRITRFRKYFVPTMVGWWQLQIFWMARCGRTASAPSPVSTFSDIIGRFQPRPSGTEEQGLLPLQAP